MSKLLHIDSSILGSNSVSRQLSAQVVDSWRAHHPATEVDYLDLASDTPAHFSSDALGFKMPSGDPATAGQATENALSEALVTQFLEADVLVIGAPMYNFTVPSQLKAWLDRLAQPGRTFRYGEKGPEGLSGGKTILIVSTRGGVYSNSDAGNAMDHQESLLKGFFGFLGVTDIRVVRAEGLAMGEAAKTAALAAAHAELKVQVRSAANQPAMASLAA
jgi:FMN-dependent NADH-azoreductase